MMPNLRITSLLAEVDHWTGFSDAFTHLHSGAPAEDRRVVLTAVLADGTNLGLTRMAEACSVASYRQLVWTAAWHPREETYRRALAILVLRRADALAGRSLFTDSAAAKFPRYLCRMSGGTANSLRSRAYLNIPRPRPPATSATRRLFRDTANRASDHGRRIVPSHRSEE